MNNIYNLKDISKKMNNITGKSCNVQAFALVGLNVSEYGRSFPNAGYGLIAIENHQTVFKFVDDTVSFHSFFTFTFLSVKFTVRVSFD